MEYDLHNPPHDPTTYANAVATGFYQQIKAKDSKAQVGVVVDGSSAWDQIVLTRAKYDFVEYHFYAQAPRARIRRLPRAAGRPGLGQRHSRAAYRDDLIWRAGHRADLYRRAGLGLCESRQADDLDHAIPLRGAGRRRPDERRRAARNLVARQRRLQRRRRRRQLLVEALRVAEFRRLHDLLRRPAGIRMF